MGSQKLPKERINATLHPSFSLRGRELNPSNDRLRSKQYFYLGFNGELKAPQRKD